MPKAKPIASLSGMIDSNMEDDTLNADAFQTPDSNQENAAPAKKKSGRPKATAKRFTKPKRLSGGSVASKPTAAPKRKAGKRAPLKEQAHNQQAEDTEEVDEFVCQTDNEPAMDELVEAKQLAKRKVQGKATGKGPKNGPVKLAGAVQKDGEFEYTPTAVRQTKGRKKAAPQIVNATKHQTSNEPHQNGKIIQETQVPMDVDTSGIRREEDQEEEDEAIPQSLFRRTKYAGATSHQRQLPIPRRRAGSTSDTEKTAGDPAMRRKLGDLTRKFENLELKYTNLRESGIKEAETNFEKLKTQSEAKAKGKNISCTTFSRLINLQLPTTSSPLSRKNSPRKKHSPKNPIRCKPRLPHEMPT